MIVFNTKQNSKVDNSQFNYLKNRKFKYQICVIEINNTNNVDKIGKIFYTMNYNTQQKKAI
jgi:hypothetical protein